MSSRGFADCGSGRLYYEITGEGPPVVLVHGFALDHRLWHPQVAYLSSRFRVITYDCRGFGRSSLPVAPYDHADDLRRLLAELSITRPHLVGLSMGGRIAINYALAHPEDTRSLALIGSDLGGYRFALDCDGCDPGSWLAHEIFASAQRHPHVLDALRMMVADYSGWHWRHDDPRSPGDLDAIDRLASIAAPTTVIVGDEDLPDFHEIARLLSTRIPGARAEHVPDVGHLVNLETAEVCNTLLRRHILP